MPSARPPRSQSRSPAKKSTNTRASQKRTAQKHWQQPFDKALDSIIEKTFEKVAEKVVDVAPEGIRTAAEWVRSEFSEVRDQRRDKRAAQDLARTLGEKYVEIPLGTPPRRHYVVFRKRLALSGVPLPRNRSRRSRGAARAAGVELSTASSQAPQAMIDVGRGGSQYADRLLPG